MSVSYPTFELLKERGLAAYKAGNYGEAKPILMQAAAAVSVMAASWFDTIGAMEVSL